MKDSLSNNDYNLRDLQICFTEILRDIDDICKKNNIVYFLVEGTALGAKRHNGFIPWDDDLDIAMARKDYDLFKSIFINDEYMMSKYFYQDSYTDKNYPIPFAKIRKNNTIFIEEETEKIDMHQGVYVDIFPIDNLAKGRFKRLLQLYSCQLYESLLRGNIPNNFLKRFVVTSIRTLHLSNFSKKVFLAILSNFGKQTGKYYSNYMCGSSITFNGDDIFPARDILFEDKEYPCFNKLEIYLSIRYGDYMQLPSEEERLASQHNSFYKL